MSSFGAKRKARIIQTFDEEGDDVKAAPTSGGEEQSDQSAPPERIKFGRNKPAKSSALRRTINVDDDESQSGAASAPDATARDDEDDDSSAPVVVRPTMSRAGSSKLKKRPATSRVSFGPSEEAADEEDASAGSAVTKPSTAKKPLGQRILANNALRKSSYLAGNIPLRFGGQEEAPRYSKEYLEELQSSTPNTPQNLASLQIHDEDEMHLDQSELEGALVVPSTEVAPLQTTTQGPAAHILTEAEIRERKERRARLAKEAEFIPLEGSSDDEQSRYGAGGRMTVHFPTKKKETRLVAEDEDLGEGYDEFVSDGGLALGKKAEREAARRHRQEMAELIQAAEEGSSADSDDSEAERRAAYEAAQRRAGMDGLHHRLAAEDQDRGDMLDGSIGPDVIPRMKPLPKLNEVLQRMREIVQGLEDQVSRKRARIADLEREKEEILAREKEVQEILNQVGAKYQAAIASAGGNAADVARMVGQSPLRAFPPGIAGDLPVERGLESFGVTPTRGFEAEEIL